MNITIDGCNCGCSAGPGAGQDKGRGDVLRSSSVVELFNVDINEHQFTQYSELQSPKNLGEPNHPTSNIVANNKCSDFKRRDHEMQFMKVS